MKRFGILLMLMALCVLAGLIPAQAEEESIWEAEAERVMEASPITAALPVRTGVVEMKAVKIDGVTWLFLPSFARLSDLSLTADGETLAWEMLEEHEDAILVRTWRAGEPLTDVRIMQSRNLRALFLFSNDPLHQGRAYVDDCERHVNETTGSMAIVDTDATVNYAGKLTQIRGRGNYTWTLEKKSYQIKLEDRVDLLRTGNPQERNRKWVLLAEMADNSMLHNRLMLDLALEMGMEDASHSEHVDVYYDGEYRGLYLLAEKVETGEGRMDVGDYDKLVEGWNNSIGQFDLESLEVREGRNRFDNPFYYLQNLAEAGQPGEGTFVLEMEHESNTLSDRCWFRMSDGSVLAVKNPQNASENMMRYVSERLEEARQTLQNGGVHPQSGRTVEEDFDVDAFARLLLLNELACNQDSYTYSSSWFVLPAGETRFQPGTPWDFDLALRYRRDGRNSEGVGLKDQSGWTAEFYSCSAVAKAMQRICEQELYPVVMEILLGDRPGKVLQTLDGYADEIRASYRMNDVLWDCVEYGAYLYGDSLEEEISILRSFLTERMNWLAGALRDGREDADAVTLWGRAAYMRVNRKLEVHACTWNHAEVVSAEWEQLTEATEDEYAKWRLEVVIAPVAGYQFNDPHVTFNGTSLQHERLDDGNLRIAVCFEDPSYRPVDYDGEDIGSFYNPDVYAQNHPEIAALYEGDPEGLMEYFCDAGMEEGQMGNAFFQPEEILHYNPELLGVLGTDWHLYYWDFPYYGLEEGWLNGGDRGFTLKVEDAL